MVKAIIGVTIDDDVLKGAKLKSLNISGFLNDALRQYLNTADANITEKNIQLVEKELKILENSLTKTQIEVESKRKNLENYKNKLEIEEKSRLKQESERLLELKTCKVCLQTLHDKDKKVEWSKGIFIHSSCLNNLSKEAKERLNQKNEVGE